MVLDEDQPGLMQLLHLRRFFLEVVPWAELRPAPELVTTENAAPGTMPLAMATPERSVVTVYIPAGGDVSLDLPVDVAYDAYWYNPRTGHTSEIPGSDQVLGEGLGCFTAPEGEEAGHPWDWVLVLQVPSLDRQDKEVQADREA